MRRRLALAIVGVAAGAVVLFAVPLGVTLHKVYRDEELLRLERDTVAATRGIDVGPGSGGDPVEIPRSTDRRVVYDTAGHALAGTPRAKDLVVASEAVRSRRPAVRDSGGDVIAAVPILNDERVTGVLVAERSGANAAEDARQAWLLLAALAAAVILAAAAAAFLLARGLSRPLERLAGSARRLGLGDFSARAPRTDVAEVNAVAEALDATAERLGDMVGRERAFSADASHQLRTPVTALRILLEEAELKHEGADAAVALRQVDRLEQTIDTLLAAARGTRGGSETTDLTQIAEEADSIWRPRLAVDGRRFQVRAGSGQVPVMASEGVLREILNVLLENAAHHGRGTVTLTVRADEDWARVEVRDEGPGFGSDPERAFVRGRSRDGHGIGLALAQSLAHAEGGRLSIPVSGPGAVVVLALQVSEPAE
ncbi:MAG TPA: HAMP domain-containing sensor histidine kinase [Thermoleophilaceae bacterium]|jgi:signal transduction histidine kinase|nr:HAMP domain-containing sensor histidine kinase [Thermoleophilaceae bacterium]